MLNKIIYSPLVKLQTDTQFPIQDQSRSASFFKTQEIILTSGSKFTIVTTANGLLKESLYLNRDDWWKTALDKTEKFKRISSPIFVAGNPGYNNYYHWTYQIWTSILLAINENRNAAGIQVLGPPLNSWRRGYINLLGQAIQYREVDLDSAYFLDHAYWCDAMWGGYSFRPSIEVLRALENFASKFTNKTPARIYISRKDTLRRGVANEDELERILVGRGFTPVLLSGLPLTAQIELFRGAEFIIAPHGAGLTNIIFSGNKKKLIELMADDYCNQCFRVIANAKAFDYIGIVNPSTKDSRGYHFSKINVDIQLLNSAISEMENLNVSEINVDIGPLKSETREMENLNEKNTCNWWSRIFRKSSLRKTLGRWK